MGLEFLFFCGFTIAAVLAVDQWHMWIALFFLSNIVCLSFILDAFLATILRLRYPDVFLRPGDTRGAKVAQAIMGTPPLSLSNKSRDQGDHRDGAGITKQQSLMRFIEHAPGVRSSAAVAPKSS
jgi:hypothetical protein